MQRTVPRSVASVVLLVVMLAAVLLAPVVQVWGADSQAQGVRPGPALLEWLEAERAGAQVVVPPWVATACTGPQAAACVVLAAGIVGYWVYSGNSSAQSTLEGVVRGLNTWVSGLSGEDRTALTNSVAELHQFSLTPTQIAALNSALLDGGLDSAWSFTSNFASTGVPAYTGPTWTNTGAYAGISSARIEVASSRFEMSFAGDYPNNTPYVELPLSAGLHQALWIEWVNGDDPEESVFTLVGAGSSGSPRWVTYGCGATCDGWLSFAVNLWFVDPGGAASPGHASLGMIGEAELFGGDWFPNSTPRGVQHGVWSTGAIAGQLLVPGEDVVIDVPRTADSYVGAPAFPGANPAVPLLNGGVGPAVNVTVDFDGSLVGESARPWWEGMFGGVWSGIQGVKQGITDLPGNMTGALTEALEGLFVPSEGIQMRLDSEYDRWKGIPPYSFIAGVGVAVGLVVAALSVEAADLCWDWPIDGVTPYEVCIPLDSSLSDPLFIVRAFVDVLIMVWLVGYIREWYRDFLRGE